MFSVKACWLGGNVLDGATSGLDSIDELLMDARSALVKDVFNRRSEACAKVGVSVRRKGDFVGAVTEVAAEIVGRTDQAEEKTCF